MPADLRISQLVVEPQNPEAMAPLRFSAECANVGDEGTDPFSVFFELDQADNVAMTVQNVPPQATEWVSWDHDGIGAGNHFIHCEIDVSNAVPESDENNLQSRSVYFTVADIEFAPQDARGETDYDKVAMANAVIAAINGRVGLWFTYAVQATEEWEIEAKRRVAADYGDADATVDAAPVIAAFAEAMLNYVPGMSTALGIMKDVYELGGLVRSYMGDQPIGLVGARARLTAAIDDVKLATGAVIRQQIQGADGRLRARLSPTNPTVRCNRSSTARPSRRMSHSWRTGWGSPSRHRRTRPRRSSR